MAGFWSDAPHAPLVRLGLGLEHIDQDQIPVMLVCGPVGGVAGWYFVSRQAKMRKSD
jgi:hypothetical protein